MRKTRQAGSVVGLEEIILVRVYLPFKNNDFVFDFGAGDADIVVFDGISGESFDSDFPGMKISQRGINLRQR